MRTTEICSNKRGENMIATTSTTQNDMRIVVIPAKTKEEIKSRKNAYRWQHTAE